MFPRSSAIFFSPIVVPVLPTLLPTGARPSMLQEWVPKILHFGSIVKPLEDLKWLCGLPKFGVRIQNFSSTTRVIRLYKINKGMWTSWNAPTVRRSCDIAEALFAWGSIIAILPTNASNHASIVPKWCIISTTCALPLHHFRLLR